MMFFRDCFPEGDRVCKELNDQEHQGGRERPQGETGAETGRCECEPGMQGDFWLQEKGNGSSKGMAVQFKEKCPRTSLTQLCH